MKRTIRKIAALGTAIAATGAAQAGAIHAGHFHDATALSSTTVPVILAAGGEAGEGGGGTVDEDLAYHVTFGEIAGKLTVGVALYELGEAEAARERMIRPTDAVYADLKPMMTELNAPGAEAELTALADAVDAGAPVDEVKAKLEAAIAAIEASAAPEAPRELALTVVQLVRNAGADYARGVADGKVVDAGEYQDAWGYVQAAKRLVAAAPDFMTEEYGEAFKTISGYLDSLDTAWPDLTGKDAPGLEPSVIAATASRIEIASLRID